MWTCTFEQTVSLANIWAWFINNSQRSHDISFHADWWCVSIFSWVYTLKMLIQYTGEQELISWLNMSDPILQSYGILLFTSSLFLCLSGLNKLKKENYLSEKQNCKIIFCLIINKTSFFFFQNLVWLKYIFWRLQMEMEIKTI